MFSYDFIPRPIADVLPEEGAGELRRRPGLRGRRALPGGQPAGGQQQRGISGRSRGESMVSIWIIYGSYMDNLWNIYG